MGTQGSPGRKVLCGHGALGRVARSKLLSLSLALPLIMPALAGCSSWSNPAQTASAPPPQSSDTSTAGVYPQQSLADVFRGSSASAQTTAMPRPPSTYTPSGQPYSPPADQQYAAPSAQTYASPSAPQAYSAPPRYAAPAAADTGEYDAAANAYPYPRQSLLDAFKGSTSSSAPAQPAMPHPPSSYTPAGQPYSPPPGQQPAYGQSTAAAPAAPPPYGQSAAAAPAAPPPQAGAEDQAANAYPYPKQNLLDIFSSKPAQ